MLPEENQPMGMEAVGTIKNIFPFPCRWKMSQDGRQPWMENNLGLKTTLDGRQPWMEDNLRWKKTFDGRQSWMEEDLVLRRSENAKSC